MQYTFKFTLKLEPMAEPIEKRACGYKWSTFEEARPFLVSQYIEQIKSCLNSALYKINNAHRNKVGRDDENDILSAEGQYTWEKLGDFLNIHAKITLTGYAQSHQEFEPLFDQVINTNSTYAINLEVHPIVSEILYFSSSSWIPAFSRSLKHVHDYEHVQYAPSSQGFVELIKCKVCGSMAQRNIPKL